MRDYVILTDSSCDLPAPLAEELGLAVIPLSVYVDDKQYTNFLDGRDIAPANFYALLRSGKTGTTAAANIEQFTSVMEAILGEGKDVLYLGFSSALSGTYSAGAVAAGEMAAKHPEAKVLTVDTLCASLGQGLLVYLAAAEKKKGQSIEQVRDFVEQTKLHLCHWFTVDDLNFLKRGGRISSTTALVGTLLGIKPILRVDDEGRLVSAGKTRGRQNAINGLFHHMTESAPPSAVETVFISHGDCVEDAEALANMVRRQWKVETLVISHVGPVIGAHSGPGTLALFFVGDKR